MTNFTNPNTNLYCAHQKKNQLHDFKMLRQQYRPIYEIANYLAIGENRGTIYFLLFLQ